MLMRLRPYAVPLALLAAAIALVVFAVSPVDAVWASAPLVLKPGAVQTLEFKSKLDGASQVGVEMDQALAKRLFPCTADALLSSTEACPPDRVASWPVALSFRLTADGKDLPPAFEPSSAESGGEYEGDTGYTWIAGYITLEKGRRYRLVVRSLKDGNALQPAHPRLVLEDPKAGFYEEKALESLASLLAAALLTLAGLIWGVWAWWRSRRIRAGQ
jgi:hypothetical protein